eukprot:2135416-Alexandrium_andersonii.AAC.1
MLEVQPITETFQLMQRIGRVQAALVDIGLAAPIMIVNFYAWADSHNKAQQLAQTNRLLCAIFDELHAQPPVPAILLGDLNALPEQVPELASRIAGGKYFDVAALPQLAGEAAPIKTCLAHSAKQMSRRDFVFMP